MVDTSTLYLILAMAGFIIVAVLMIHHHNCSDLINRKRNEFKSISQQLTPRIEMLEQEIVDLKIQIDETDEQIDVLQQQTQS